MEKKKVAAATGAVMALLRAEEERAAMGAGMVNVWGLSGRQEIMRMRSMLQMRVFRGSNRDRGTR
jgi:hypothetical protein